VIRRGWLTVEASTGALTPVVDFFDTANLLYLGGGGCCPTS
jgi:hypothetical protein